MGKVHFAPNEKAIAIYMMVSGIRANDRVSVKKSQPKGNTTENGSMINDMEKASASM